MVAAALANLIWFTLEPVLLGWEAGCVSRDLSEELRGDTDKASSLKSAGQTVALMGLWSPENVQVSYARAALSQQRGGKEALVPSRWGSAWSLHPERLRVRPLGKEPATWGSAVRRAEWAEVRISGHASELCWGLAPTSTPCNAPRDRGSRETPAAADPRSRVGHSVG